MLFGRRQGADRGFGAVELVESSHDVHQRSRLQEDETTGAVVIGQRAEGLVAHGDLIVQSPRCRPIHDVMRQRGHVLVDPAESVDGDLFDEELLGLSNLYHLLIRDQRLVRHALLLDLPILSSPRQSR